ncbi:MAG: sigma-54-dependent Fis family transcriptional regulator, partial [Desulfobacteraceae bacterium]|nr:sigma-54-dependent Fis family transcriptional regulator [Desulfobacteraceae bacterium]
DKPIPDIPKNLIEQMEAYPFKGNIRELKSMVHDAISRYKKGPFTQDLFKVFAQNSKSSGKESFTDLPTLKEASRELVEKALKQTRGNQSAAAGILGISQQALSKRIQKLKSGGK